MSAGRRPRRGGDGPGSARRGAPGEDASLRVAGPARDGDSRFSGFGWERSAGIGGSRRASGKGASSSLCAGVGVPWGSAGWHGRREESGVGNRFVWSEAPALGGWSGRFVRRERGVCSRRCRREPTVVVPLCAVVSALDEWAGVLLAGGRDPLGVGVKLALCGEPRVVLLCVASPGWNS